MGYSPWGHKESDMTERLHFLLSSCSEKVNQVLLKSSKILRKESVSHICHILFDLNVQVLLCFENLLLVE